MTVTLIGTPKHNISIHQHIDRVSEHIRDNNLSLGDVESFTHQETSSHYNTYIGTPSNSNENLKLEDPFIDVNYSTTRLMSDYKKHKSLVVGFDFDNTIYDFHRKGHSFPRVEQLLIDCYNEGFTLVCFSGNSDEELIKNRCSEFGLEDFMMNESPLNTGTIKPYMNILLDDRAGLRAAVEDLESLLIAIKLFKRIKNGQ